MNATKKASTSKKKTTRKKTTSTKKPASGGKSQGKNLVIVESPAKARTIERYLGSGYKVVASVGHVIDLPKSKLGVNVEKDFEPEYVTIRGKKKVLDSLKSAAKEADTIYLATDPDREGEAIAWHVSRYLKLKDKKVLRAVFHEITKPAVQAAIASPSTLNENLCMAQQTRRILDRLVGYEISPLLWKNVKVGLSAGRVQSVAVRLVCEREAEIGAFKPVEYWTVEIQVSGANPPPFVLRLSKLDGAKSVIPDEKTAAAVVKAVKTEKLLVDSVEKKPWQRKPQPPFITSSLQQEAHRKLRFSPQRTMRIAQGLYEGVEIDGGETTGLITYMRTDSTRIASSAQEGIRAFIEKRFGPEYLPEKPNVYATKKGAQDAHEAIRPTLLDRPPESLEAILDADQLRVYKLIWDRFASSQMLPAKFERTTIEVPLSDGKYLFVATGSVLKFPGFLAVYEEGHDQGDAEKSAKDETADRLPEVAKGEVLKPLDYLPEQHFTQPPPRYTSSSLIRELENRGIGRPSTYAAIISTILDKNYVEEEKRAFRATDLGRIVTDILVESFPEILDSEFTARMEQELDDIGEGNLEWLDVMRKFYDGFSKRLEVARKEMRSPRGKEEETDIACENCGSKMVVKWGRNGHFLACTNYPECKTTMPFTKDDEGNVVIEKTPETDEICSKCGAPMVVRRGRRGPFLACSTYPECKETRNLKEIVDGKAVADDALPDTDAVCENCGEKMVVRTGRRGPFIACPGYPKCRNTKPIAEIVDGKAIPGKSKGRGANGRPRAVETDVKCENCGKPMLLRNGRKGPFLGCSGYPKCRTIVDATPEIIEKYAPKETDEEEKSEEAASKE